jgi:hypothetical protein
MINENKCLLRMIMRHVDRAKLDMNSFNFKQAYEQIEIAYSELQQLADSEKMNVIE